MTAISPLAERVVAGELPALARALTLVERRRDGVNELLADLHRRTGGAQVLGVTGPPGSGKSTLVTGLTAEYRARGRTVGVIAVDPSSILTGGAILGDRIRMTGLAGDPGVFIRSIATRGALGGLSRAALDAITVLDAAGKDVIVLETVGVGQAEVDVLAAAQTVAVVSVPGMGDDVQAIKAGLLEIADVHVVNKADRDGAHKTVAELREMLKMTPRTVVGWNVPIRQTTAATGDGVARLADTFDEHRAWLDTSGEGGVRERRNAGTRIRWMAEEFVMRGLRPGAPDFDTAVAAVVGRRTDPAQAARELVRALCP
ncbi:methylmalonyl Co-A mutase-associated GTPase MeaB [Sciscionella marina]|uniref:methylmalonyl Co-A mutase-associated GTPase MeaB n=1 Tax=Sciscionella marina TaxID=508770 RepID=UPI000381A6FE|nr:methylmalonyl Co-A mutase-associated GTPase MeaB [Sciscionella marina]